MSTPSAQEIAEKLANEFTAEWPDTWNDIAIKDDAEIRARYKTRILSAITAAVAQAKEEENILRDALFKIGQNGDVWSKNHAIGALRNAEALELKEPATNNVNAVLQEAKEEIAREASSEWATRSSKHYASSSKPLWQIIVEAFDKYRQRNNEILIEQADGDYREGNFVTELLSEHSNAAEQAAAIRKKTGCKGDFMAEGARLES